MEIKCSRCKKRKREGEDWKGFKECPKCHARTERRYPKIRQYEPSDFKVEQLFSFPSFEEFFAITVKTFGKKTKREDARKEWELRKTDWERDNSKRIAQLDSLFAIKTYPLHSQECIKVRIEARKCFVDGDDSIDIFPILDHCKNCADCNNFFYALRNGFLALEPTIDPEQEAELRKEGFCSKKEWNELMNQFSSGQST